MRIQHRYLHKTALKIKALSVKEAMVFFYNRQQSGGPAVSTKSDRFVARRDSRFFLTGNLAISRDSRATDEDSSRTSLRDWEGSGSPSLDEESMKMKKAATAALPWADSSEQFSNKRELMQINAKLGELAMAQSALSAQMVTLMARLDGSPATMTGSARPPSPRSTSMRSLVSPRYYLLPTRCPVGASVFRGEG